MANNAQVAKYESELDEAKDLFWTNMIMEQAKEFGTTTKTKIVNDIKEIRDMLKADHERGATLRSAAKQAVNLFLSKWK